MLLFLTLLISDLLTLNPLPAPLASITAKFIELDLLEMDDKEFHFGIFVTISQCV